MKKTPALLMRCAVLALLAVGASAPSFAYDFEVRGSLPWTGWLNWCVPVDTCGGDYWWIGSLPATISGDIVALAPHTWVTTYWNVPAGSGTMDAVLFVEDHTLAGQSVTFSGVVLFNTLVSPYVATAFVRDFDADNGYTFEESKVPLVSGQRFSVSREIASGSGHFVEIGFETNGPNADPDGVGLLGSVQVAPADPDVLFPKLLADVTGLGPGTSLADKVKVAQFRYAGADVEASCGVLKGLVNEVRAQQGKTITPMMLADQLVAEASAVMVVIGCK